MGGFLVTTKYTRRGMLRTTALGAGALATSRLPALAQDAELPTGAAGKLTVIHRQEYFQAAQDAFRDICQDFADARGVALDISTTNAEAFGDFLGKMAASVRAGNPPDLAYTSNVSIAQMHLLGLLEDVTDLVEEASSRYGGVVPGINAEEIGTVDGRWYAVPFITQVTGVFFRGDKLAEAGIDPETLTTWEARRKAALAISDPDNEFWGWGITPNQSGDGWGAMTQILNAFGGHFTDESGKKVQLNTPEALAAYEFIRETYDRNGHYAAMLPPGIESWGDSSNNEAYLSGKVGFTHNAFSVYAQAKRDGNPVYENTVVLRMPDANNGERRDAGQPGGWLTVFKGAPNAELAKELILSILEPENFNRMSSVAGGLLMPTFETQWTGELIAADPNFAIIKEQAMIPEPYIGPSWPADPTAAFDAIRARGIFEQSLGNMISGRMTPEQALEDAHRKIVNLFEEGGIPQD
jgi:multiple sugar transport system substrate-binding protein